MFVKICGLRDAQSVAAAVAAGADAVGFVFAESVRRISPEAAVVAAHHVPADVKRVAVMRHPSNEEWQTVLDAFAPDVLQTDAADFDALDVPDSVVRWPVVRQVAGAHSGLPEGVFVYEGADSGTGETIDWTEAKAVARNGQMILAGGLHAGNVVEAIATVRPFGVDVSSGVESSRGNKDIELIGEFVGAIRAAEKHR